MISVIIETRDSADALVRTLGALVGAAVDGVVREVVVCDLGSADHTPRIADDAGCRVVGGDIAAAIAAARSDWLMFLEPGARPVGDWQGPVAAHVAGATMAAQFRRARESRPTLFGRFFATALAQGLLVRKGQALSRARPGQGAESIARGLAVRRLAAELAVAPGH